VTTPSNKIPAAIHQVWAGDDMIPERLAVYMAKNVEYCKYHEYDHCFWRIINDEDIILKYPPNHFDHLKIENVFEDVRVLEMIADPHLQRVMKSDIFRFNLLYKFGGFYADLDVLLLQSLEKYREMEYVCGYEKPRPVVCTALIGAPTESPINKAVIEFILAAHQKMKRENQYPKNLWEVLTFTGPDMLTDILKSFPSVTPFPFWEFYPWPAPEIQRPFTIHYYAGSKPNGWAAQGCKEKKCSECIDKKVCNIVLEKAK
jgi:mannosyltransferase OCH1-like enzyme